MRSLVRTIRARRASICSWLFRSFVLDILPPRCFHSFAASTVSKGGALFVFAAGSAGGRIVVPFFGQRFPSLATADFCLEQITQDSRPPAGLPHHSDSVILPRLSKHIPPRHTQTTVWCESRPPLCLISSSSQSPRRWGASSGRNRSARSYGLGVMGGLGLDRLPVGVAYECHVRCGSPGPETMAQ